LDDPRPAIAWRADRLVLGAVYALPAVALTFADPELGIASGIGATRHTTAPRVLDERVRTC